MKVWIRYKDGSISTTSDIYNEQDLMGLKIGLSYIGASVIKVEREKENEKGI